MFNFAIVLYLINCLVAYLKSITCSFSNTLFCEQYFFLSKAYFFGAALMLILAELRIKKDSPKLLNEDIIKSISTMVVIGGILLMGFAFINL